MGWQAWFTLAVVFLMVVVLVRDVVSPAAAVVGTMVVLFVAGIITPAQAFSGFSNPAPITVAALYVLARAVEKTGGLQPILAATLGEGVGKRRSLSRLLAPTAAASAFLNNTPIVAMLAPQVTEWAERRGISPSRFLMPLSFAAILGGVVTVIGTSTNLVVSGLLEEYGREPIGMFEITRVGLPLAVVGVLFLVVASPFLLRERRGPRRALEEGFREFLVGMEVAAGGTLDGVAVEAGGLRHLKGVFLVEIERTGEIIAPVTPTTILRGGDRLTFVGRADIIPDLQATRGLVSAEEPHIEGFDSARHTFFEAVIGPASPLVGKTLKEAGFRGKYQAAVVAIHRAGSRVRAKFGEVRLRVGDTLLLLTDPGFRDRWRDRSDFLLVSRLGGTPPGVSRKAWLVGLITLAIVLVAGSGFLPILQAALIGAIALVVLGVLTGGEARAAIDLEVILVIAAAFGIGAAIEASGLAEALATGLVDALAWLGPTGVLLGVLIATVALTELITNNAAAVLMFPIALSTADQLALDPRPFAIAIAIAASASFLTPIGYQTNTMVYGPGGYRFGDYARLGLPLTVLVVVVTVAVVPLFWPFN
ncbi:MAG: SLC13 family permease [Gemmatimonadota bacterium]|nr:SLC13 family permease [Gemmatimonadota bacterium]MDH3367976.1 SLC13 family permease [Gemmatimonadota bacterium]MDH3479835.1 SLC13 family permease [Gemmatimonadota bacterium]MDH5550741.1 SLC13 family permease [Gemmatimonadota bacterium]